MTKNWLGGEGQLLIQSWGINNLYLLIQCISYEIYITASSDPFLHLWLFAPLFLQIPLSLHFFSSLFCSFSVLSSIIFQSANAILILTKLLRSYLRSQIQEDSRIYQNNISITSNIWVFEESKSQFQARSENLIYKISIASKI